MALSEDKLKEIVARIVGEMIEKNQAENSNVCPSIEVTDKLEEEDIPDITEVNLKTYLAVPEAENKEEYLRLKAKTSARLGVYRAGTRYKTETMLRFRADHAVAMDAVFTDVPEEVIKSNGLFEVQTMCESRDQYLTRPDLGRKFDEENLKLIKSQCKKSPKVQIYASDGLSSTALIANLKTVMPSIMQGLKTYGYDVGTPFFVKYGRVGAMDVITEALDAEVTVVLIGERPGLATGESMSAYMTYKGQVGMSESGRTVVSNIHSGGTPAAEAGAHIADIIHEMIKQKASGLDLKI
ncbi:ethanolamine ammonia-lyase subunit EutC [Cellulosilyticum sp. I15G10I2]|uniref:ethanolamine ammonia-lyase subunit EutC n=1 Tax=Cellulosilyticum sp. I15G10I2 TaxID=1892843 RepID=UPI00085BD873|nr:ethanolamine ammonia-lyase subunit EutC [Cellulosilyticum sp. I15G10I2]